MRNLLFRVTCVFIWPLIIQWIMLVKNLMSPLLIPFGLVLVFIWAFLFLGFAKYKVQTTKQGDMLFMFFMILTPIIIIGLLFLGQPDGSDGYH